MVHKGISSAVKEKIQLKYNIEKILQLPLYKCMVNIPGVAQTVLKNRLSPAINYCSEAGNFQQPVVLFFNFLIS